ncbi:MAG: SDR family oxidoreductase, partial [Bdellovibrionales bacterium]|nr:SDR family oxidoreductase [Bdellovibrionales bacterium]
KYPEQKFLALSMDVTSEESVKTVAKEVTSRFGGVEVLINNAAIDAKVTKEKSNGLEDTRFENFSLERWNKEISVGLSGAMICAKVIGSQMALSGRGVILNISSDLSVIAPDQRLYRVDGKPENQQPVKPVTYSVIKHGLVGLTKYLSTYWAKSGVRVNSLSPGGVYNDHPEEFVEKLTQLIPIGRMAEKDEYWGSVQFLCSPASSYITGQNLVADGGRSVW